jgi:hypothetical protein
MNRAIFLLLLPLFVLADVLADDGAARSGQGNTRQGSVLITFSGLYNGISPFTDITIAHRPIPPSYQPLREASPNTQPVDGGNLQTKVLWDNAFVSNHGFNPRVVDHTGDNRGAAHELGGGVLFGTSRYQMTFSHPVEIPSLFWTYFIATTKTGTISAYGNPGDISPLKVVHLNYPDAKGYVWRELTDFAGLAITRIAFDPGDDTHATGLNIDDMTVRTVAATPDTLSKH